MMDSTVFISVSKHMVIHSVADGFFFWLMLRCQVGICLLFFRCIAGCYLKHWSLYYSFQNLYSIYCIARNWSWLYSSSPVKNNNVRLRRTAIMWKNWKFLAMRWVWAWWPFASVVLTIRFPVTWLGNVWEPVPPPRGTGLSRLFNPHFLGLTLRHRNADTWTCDWHAWFSLIYTFINIDTIPFWNSKFWSLE